MINRRFPSLMCKVVSSSKIFLFLFFLFFAGDLSATEVFTTHFNRNDFLIILIPSAFILLIISALNIAIKALELTDEDIEILDKLVNDGNESKNNNYKI